MSLEVFRSLPKIELHAHLHGCIPGTTLERLAHQTEQYRDWSMPPKHRILKQCFALFDVIHDLVINAETLYDASCEVLRAFAHDNVKYLELRTTPRPTATMTKRCYIETVVRAIERTTAELESTSPIVVRLLLSCDRTRSVEDALDTVQLAHEFMAKGVIGIDFCGNPTAETFAAIRPALERARALGLKVVVHFGEVHCPAQTEQVLDFRPDRLAHGCFLTEEHQAAVVQSGVPLELCPTSNVLTKSVPSYEEHHFRYFWEHRHPLAICTDNTGVFNTTVSEEFAHLYRALGPSTEAPLVRCSPEDFCRTLTLQAAHAAFDSEAALAAVGSPDTEADN
eukprot:gnl/Trimastix_PCT/837.p1 GENE.gnl/Trimastix_PCT/837~~gnl/Trimastix_PCT/837.p1  ORF type:complete len:338 (+),score=91.25 gnl/Trimastix_PCT/837:99-1112(+)